jgi:hypothetical protein
VQVEGGKPARIVIDRRGLKGGAVATSAGPWRTSGAWWKGEASGTEEKRTLSASVPRCVAGTEVTRSKEGSWDRDEWDVLLEDGATYRLFRQRDGDHWFVDGVVD